MPLFVGRSEATSHKKRQNKTAIADSTFSMASWSEPFLGEFYLGHRCSEKSTLIESARTVWEVGTNDERGALVRPPLAGVVVIS